MKRFLSLLVLLPLTLPAAAQLTLIANCTDCGPDIKLARSGTYEAAIAVPGAANQYIIGSVPGDTVILSYQHQILLGTTQLAPAFTIGTNNRIGIGTTPAFNTQLSVQTSGINGVVSNTSDPSGNGFSTSVSGSNAWGVYASSNGGRAVFGTDSGAYGKGVLGEGSQGVRGVGLQDFGVGVYGSTSGCILGCSAGYFSGNVSVSGSLSKAGGSFKIDHPLDPENKYLSHSFVESPDMMNVYNGIVVLDYRGEATVELPAYFEELNKDFRYQLTCIGGYAPVYIGAEIADNKFVIAGGKPDLKVSWQVTGIRHDAWAETHRIVVEEEKPQGERGRYLHPQEHQKPEQMGIDFPQQQRLRDEETAKVRGRSR